MGAQREGGRRPERRRSIGPGPVEQLLLAPGSAVAIVLGHVALRQISRSGGLQSGRALAITGLALGYFGAATFVAVILTALA